MNKTIDLRFDEIALILLLAALILVWPQPASAADPGPAAGINVKVVNTPLPVSGTVSIGNLPASLPISGSVSIKPSATTPLLQMTSLPMNFHTTQPLDTSSCSALRFVLHSPSGGPSLLFVLIDPAANNASYFSTVIGSGDDGSDVVTLPPPATSIVMGVSGDCPTCALAVYCR